MNEVTRKPIGRKGVEITAKSEDGSVMGSVIMTVKSEKALIGYLGVRKSYSGQGVGGQLMNEAIRYGKEKGCRQVTGTFIPVPGSEQQMTGMVKRRGGTMDKKGNFKIELDK